MYSAIFSRSARRLATATPSAHLIRTFSVKSGPIPPKNPAQGASDSAPPSPAPAHAHAPAPPADAANVSESDALATPAPTTLSLDFAPPEPQGAERERTGAKSSRDSLSSIERRRRQLGRVSFGLFALGLLGGGVYLGREWTEDELVSRRAVRACPPPPLLDIWWDCRFLIVRIFFFREGKLCRIHDGVVRLAGSRQCST